MGARGAHNARFEVCERLPTDALHVAVSMLSSPHRVCEAVLSQLHTQPLLQVAARSALRASLARNQRRARCMHTTQHPSECTLLPQLLLALPQQLANPHNITAELLQLRHVLPQALARVGRLDGLLQRAAKAGLRRLERRRRQR